MASIASIQLGAAQLTAAFLFGGTLLYSSSFAAFLFKTLPPDEAGALLRRAFESFYLWLIATASVAAVLLVNIDLIACAVLAVVALSTVPLRQQLMPAINRASDAEDRKQFNRLHMLSVVAGLTQIAAMAYVLLRVF
ncbi:DUF4149 domain-containing protein [Congregibacter sp.]|uniref:DUF4149 domain-containing protein n=1 Tax=Congregibacter sp. TaxID=2744308 RepID=UPI003F6CD4BF